MLGTKMAIYEATAADGHIFLRLAQTTFTRQADTMSKSQARLMKQMYNLEKGAKIHRDSQSLDPSCRSAKSTSNSTGGWLTGERNRYLDIWDEGPLEDAHSTLPPMAGDGHELRRPCLCRSFHAPFVLCWWDWGCAGHHAPQRGCLHQCVDALQLVLDISRCCNGGRLSWHCPVQQRHLQPDIPSLLCVVWLSSIRTYCRRCMQTAISYRCLTVNSTSLLGSGQ